VSRGSQGPVRNLKARPHEGAAGHRVPAIRSQRNWGIRDGVGGQKFSRVSWLWDIASGGRPVVKISGDSLSKLDPASTPIRQRRLQRGRTECVSDLIGAECG